MPEERNNNGLTVLNDYQVKKIQNDLKRKEQLEEENDKLKKALKIIHRELELDLNKEDGNFYITTNYHAAPIYRYEYKLIEEVLKDASKN